jgi:hypothetical protein
MFEGSNAVRGRVHGATGAPRGPAASAGYKDIPGCSLGRRRGRLPHCSLEAILRTRRGPLCPPPALCLSTMIAVAQRQRDANDLLTANFPKNRNRTEVEAVPRASRPTRYATVEPSSSRRRETRSERPPGQVE